MITDKNLHHKLKIAQKIKKKSVVSPPIAKQILNSCAIHDDIITDCYEWLRDKNWPNVNDQDVLQYLKDENSYTDDVMKQHQALNDQIFQEIKSLISLKDFTVPYIDSEYEYYSKIEEEQEYWVHFRKHIKSAIEQIVIDSNTLSKDKDYFSLGISEVSPNHELVAYSVDYTGDEHYTIFIRNIKTGETFLDQIPNTIGSIVWNSLSNGFYYTPLTQNWRVKEVKFHYLGDDLNNDITIYKEYDIDEKDSTFQVNIRQSEDKKLLFINVESTDVTEFYYSYINNAQNIYKLVSRQQNKLYQIVYQSGCFYALTNDQGSNFRLVTIKEKNIIEENNDHNNHIDIDHKDNVEKSNAGNIEDWTEVLAVEKDQYLNGIWAYENHIVIQSLSTKTGLEEITVYKRENSKTYNLKFLKKLTFPDSAYSLSLIYTTFDAQALRYQYSSFKSPNSIFEIKFSDMELSIQSDMQSNVQNSSNLYHDVLLVKQGYSGNLNLDDYLIERIYIASEKEENILIPVSIVRKKDDAKPQLSKPLLLYGYGSYGISIAPSFRPSIFSLLNRSFTFAIAHIRGGDDLGRGWYESAKFLNKKKTFNDFISVANGLVNLGYTEHKRMIIHGGSAGGMLVGAYLNMTKHLCGGAIANVPFVDTLNTMLDSTLPLTPGEFNEWGNPQESKEYYEYIKSYSPYDNIQKKNYPPLFVTGGLHDPRVTYWEPAKWVAKLRQMKTDTNILLLKTEMSHGHKGASGRFEYIKEISLMYTFILMVLNMTDTVCD